MDSGVFFRFCFLVLLCIGLLWWLSDTYHRLMERYTGKTGLLITGLIGVPIHEMSHAVVAILFGHQIHRIVFFRYKDNEPTLGWVEHSYNRLSFRQSVGLLYVAIAPILIMPIIIALTLQHNNVLVGQGISTVLFEWVLEGKSIQPNVFFPSIISDIENLVSLMSWDNIGLFALVGCIALHASPSRADMRTVTHSLASLFGLGSIVAILYFLIHSQSTLVIYKVINFIIQSVIFAALMAEASLIFDFSSRFALRLLTTFWQQIIAKCK